MSDKIAIAPTSFAKYDSTPILLLKKKGFRVAKNKFSRKLNKNEALKLCSGCVGIIAGTEIYDSDILGKLPQLKAISRCGVGIDNIDQEAAKKKGIKIFNTPQAPTFAVAELTVALILNLLRKVSQAHIAIINGRWEKLMGDLLYGKKVGIIGLGRIGKKVSELLKSFGCKIAYADPHIKGRQADLKRLSLTELLIWADIITVHITGNDKIIGKKELRLMKKGAWLINTSRGGVVDEDALYKALKEGQLSGAALDVFGREPYIGALRQLSNVILTSHIGSYAKETRIQMERLAVKNLLQGMEGKK